jgi:hypothetical protein
MLCMFKVSFVIQMYVYEIPDARASARSSVNTTLFS